MRRLLSPLLAALAGVAPFDGVLQQAFAQPRSTPPTATTPPTDRPEGEPLRIDNVPPALMNHLRNWERASAKIEKLKGDHRRFIYDLVFEVEKRSDGIFYYEAPDKGRIDITPGKIAKGQTSGKISPNTQKPFKLEADRSERWICTGQEVLQINDQEKTYEMYPIPPQHQGANIMEGPLPFLFGMPAEKAIRRFQLTLLQENESQITLSAKPRWQSDAANYREALINLDITKGRYLPTAVKLIDPSGNLETVYTFVELEVNRKPIFPSFWEKDPFHPNLKGFRLIVNEPTLAKEPGKPGQTPRPEGPAGKAGPPLPSEGPKTAGRNEEERPAAPFPGNQALPPRPENVPSLIGLDYKKAQEVLENAGYQVKFLRGDAAPKEEFVFRVYDQQPKPRAPLAVGQVVYLRLYTRPEVAENPAPQKK